MQRSFWNQQINVGRNRRSRIRFPSRHFGRLALFVRSPGRSFAFAALKKGSAMQLMIPTREACVLLISTRRFMLIAFPRLSAKSKSASRQYFPRFQAATRFHYSAAAPAITACRILSGKGVGLKQGKEDARLARDLERVGRWGPAARGNAVRKHTYVHL